MRRTYEPEDGNRQAAAVILANPWRYGGEQAFPCVWARLFQQREREGFHDPHSWRLRARGANAGRSAIPKDGAN